MISLLKGAHCNLVDWYRRFGNKQLPSGWCTDNKATRCQTTEHRNFESHRSRDQQYFNHTTSYLCPGSFGNYHTCDTYQMNQYQ